MRNDDARGRPPQGDERVGDERLGGGIDVGGRLVEDEELRLAKEGAREGDPLALPGGQPFAPFADDAGPSPPSDGAMISLACARETASVNAASSTVLLASPPLPVASPPRQPYARFARMVPAKTPPSPPT